MHLLQRLTGSHQRHILVVTQCIIALEALAFDADVVSSVNASLLGRCESVLADVQCDHCLNRGSRRLARTRWSRRDSNMGALSSSTMLVGFEIRFNCVK
jgi:hypothetical protein